MSAPNPCQIEACHGQPICVECSKLNYCPANIQRQQIEALEVVQADLPNGTRMHTVGRIIVLTLAGAELRPGVPDGPADQDIDAAIGHLRAMKTTLAKTRAVAHQ